MLLLRDPGGQVFGGFSRRLYSASSVQPSVNYDTAIKSVIDNAPNPGYTITTFGGVSQETAIEFYIRSQRSCQSRTTECSSAWAAPMCRTEQCCSRTDERARGFGSSP